MQHKSPRMAATIFALSSIAFAFPAFSQTQGGTTSGPATGTPATLGTNGTTPTSPHQTNVLRNKGGKATQNEKPGSSATAGVGTAGSQTSQ